MRSTVVCTKLRKPKFVKIISKCTRNDALRIQECLQERNYPKIVFLFVSCLYLAQQACTLLHIETKMIIFREKVIDKNNFDLSVAEKLPKP